MESIKNHDAHKGAILDTNILISASYDIRDSHSEVVDVWELLIKNNYRLFATINTRSEYLEFHRRLALTENLFDLADEFSPAKLPKSAKAKIQTLKGSLKTSIGADPDRDQVFNESQIKKIKKEFSAGPHSGQQGWLEFCEAVLKNTLEQEDQALMERGVEYISPHDKSQTDMFNDPIDWASAIEICEKAGTPFSDSMILNALKASKLFFVVTLDFDIGYAALSDPMSKDVLVPDRLYKDYKNYHFPKQT